MEFRRIASRMAPRIFVLIFCLWVEREESDRTQVFHPSSCWKGDLPFTEIGKPVRAQV